MVAIRYAWPFKFTIKLIKFKSQSLHYCGHISYILWFHFTHISTDVIDSSLQKIYWLCWSRKCLKEAPVRCWVFNFILKCFMMYMTLSKEPIVRRITNNTIKILNSYLVDFVLCVGLHAGCLPVILPAALDLWSQCYCKIHFMSVLVTFL